MRHQKALQLTAERETVDKHFVSGGKATDEERRGMKRNLS
jgi:hypothetical protein